MNFYKHHIGDYDQATRHLSFVEDAAYSRLIRKYYAEERPLPKNLEKILRLIGARTKEEKKAVQTVLEEFFILEDDGWHNTRCDEELGVAMAKAERNRTVGKLGGRPRKTGNPEGTHKEPTGNPDGLVVEPTNNPSQTPDSRLQTPEEEKVVVVHTMAPEETPAPLVSEIVPNSRAAAISVLMRRNGVEGCNSANPIVQEWASNPKVTDDLLLTAASMAKARDVARPGPKYLDPIVADLLNPKPVKPKQDDWHRTDEGIKRKAKELGVVARAGWSYAQLKEHVWDEIRRTERQGAAA